jgi:hypothetical protein
MPEFIGTLNIEIRMGRSMRQYYAFPCRDIDHSSELLTAFKVPIGWELGLVSYTGKPRRS